ncbi:PLP-dependent aminotransferase family protein [Sporomusa termitida]|uniref:HTH-type transcriptional regulatory protein GabR n=1 Tax=Sporomusa termitida TaxID=2377 RepID=A0A517DQ44_9FIRM|nr:PLP-dependent aminotransferase family protein [Sporomusa termitida]QDR79396.1 HTH-type transcriptional regulatory protein GabR [Sporomusa termitida]
MWGIALQRHSEVALARQLYQILREKMTDGQLRPGEALPSTRELAKQLALSRNTICEAYEMLAAEGYIISSQGAKTRVADGLQLEKAAPAFTENTPPAAPAIAADFQTGRPDIRQFPRHLWLQLLRKATNELSPQLWGYSGPAGLPVLRREISAWLYRSRGLAAEPQDIFITAGATQGLKLLAGEGQAMILEDPCHSGLRQVLQNRGISIYPVPVDRQGLQTGNLNRNGACAVYVTPSHQFPLGGILPASRRAELVRYARENGLYLLEDDYDSEFRYAGPPVAPLYSLDPQQVIYIGTFSKILFPALRIGYVILPRRLQARWRHLRTYADVQNPPFAQAALAEFLQNRKLDRHIQNMRRLYGHRRHILLQTLTAMFGPGWSAWGDTAGLHLAVEFPGMRFDDMFVRHCQSKGLRLATVETHCLRKGEHRDKLLLGYGHLEPAEIKQGLALLRTAFPA